MTDQYANHGTPGGTNTAPIFVQNAQDLLVRLMPHAEDPVAGPMLREVKNLLENFERWKTERPDNQVRIAGIQKLMNLNRQAMDFLTNDRTREPVIKEALPQRRDPSFIRRMFLRITGAHLR